MFRKIRLLLVRLPLTFMTAVILVGNPVKSDSTWKAQPEVVFKLIKPLRLVGSEKLDFTVTFQNGHRVKTAVDESKPFCQVFFNSDTIQSHRGNVGPMSMMPAPAQDGLRVLPGVGKGGGLISVQVSSSKAEAFPEKNSFSVSCSLLSADGAKASLFTYEKIGKILGPSFTVINLVSRRGVAQDN